MARQRRLAGEEWREESGVDRSAGRGLVWVVLVVVVGGCGTATDIEDIKNTQAQILSRLAALEKNDRALLASLRAGQLQREPDPELVHDIEIGESPSKGPLDAPITIVEFADFQCPFSASAEALVDQILATYTDEVRFVVKQYPLTLLHQDARNAARAALAAHRQGRFWEMHDLLFENQHALDLESLLGYAARAGLDVAQFEKDLASPEVEGQLRADISAARKAEITGTPAFFIDGRRVTSRSFESFRVLIEDALKHASNSDGAAES